MSGLSQLGLRGQEILFRLISATGRGILPTLRGPSAVLFLPANSKNSCRLAVLCLTPKVLVGCDIKKSAA